MQVMARRLRSESALLSEIPKGVTYFTAQEKPISAQKVTEDHYGGSHTPSWVRSHFWTMRRCRGASLRTTHMEII